MRRHLKTLVVGVSLVAALVLTITRREANRVGQHGHGIHVTAGSPSGAAAIGDKKPADLSSLRDVDATLARIEDKYVDRTRIDPNAMLLGALDSMQKNIAEVMVEPHPAENRVTVRVDSAQKDWDTSDVDAVWNLSSKLKDIFGFVSTNLRPDTDAKDLEYAAANGMLSTLDPHSVLLTAEQYKEMQLTTVGHFGGLGIQIGVRKGLLTVIKPIKGTPAEAAGIKAGDKIVRIEGESTMNMMLNDAVSRLRGDPNTQVHVEVQKKSETPRKIVMTRALINVDTVSPTQLLEGNIGYLKVKQFAGSSYDDMHKVIEEMKQKGPLRGVILDLRNDPGGLLDQAIKIADEFVDAGTIVTTVASGNKDRRETKATDGKTQQPHIPMAVLVNGGSASASEIVAGALKGLDRAVIIGSRTFGKGSVQVLYENDDGSALKLTIAQYLTPGDVSIQSVGIVPDIALEPTALTKDHVWLFRQSKGLREQDLDAHLISHNTRTGDVPTETLRYLSEVAAKKKEKIDKAALRDDDKATTDPSEDQPDEETLADDDDDKFVEDYEITLARELLAQAHGWRRHEVLAGAKPFFEKKAIDEQAKIVEGMKKLGVDWTAPPAGVHASPKLEVAVTTDRPKNEVHAGETVNVQMTVKNTGTVPAWQVRAITKSDDPLVDDRELPFGKIAPGESRTWSVPVKVERFAITRLDQLRFDVSDDSAKRLTGDTLALKIDGIARPRFAYSYQMVDDIKGNGDGILQPGETVRLHVTVKNTGDGKSGETWATLSNKSGDGVEVDKGRFDVSNLTPGDSRTVDFTFAVTPDFHGESASLQMDVYDQTLHEYVTDKLAFPLAPAVLAAPLTGTLALVTGTDVYIAASAKNAVLGHVEKGTILKATGVVGDFYRVEIEPGRPGFIARSSAVASKAAPTKSSALATALQVVPPQLTLDNPPLAVEGASFHLTGTITDARQVADVYVYVYNKAAKIDYKKVFYASNRKGADAHAMKFDAPIPVWPGANQIHVVARQSNQVQSQQTLIVQGNAAPVAAVTK